MQFTVSKTDKELKQIIDLQNLNLEEALSKEEIKTQGYVTVVHSIPLLKIICGNFKHIIALENDQIIAYALIMCREFADCIPVLEPMFEKINETKYKQGLLRDSKYAVMGQICIDKKYRAKGVFRGLYEKMQIDLKEDFDYIITEVAKRNTRSLRAHNKVGFENIREYSTQDEEWVILLLIITK